MPIAWKAVAATARKAYLQSCEGRPGGRKRTLRPCKGSESSRSRPTTRGPEGTVRGIVEKDVDALWCLGIGHAEGPGCRVLAAVVAVSLFVHLRHSQPPDDTYSPICFTNILSTGNGVSSGRLARRSSEGWRPCRKLPSWPAPSGSNSLTAIYAILIMGGRFAFRKL